MNKFWLLLLLLFSSCSQQEKQKIDLSKIESISYKPVGKFTKGKFKRGIYHNDFYGFEFVIPDSWEILSQQQINNRYQGKKEEMIEKDQSIENKYERSKENWKTLFIVKKKDAYPSINFQMEDLSMIPNTSNSKEYVEFAVDFIDHGINPLTYPKYFNNSVEVEDVGGREFILHCVDIEYKNGGSVINCTYTANFDSLLLNLIACYETPSDFEEIKTILKENLKWNR